MTVVNPKSISGINSITTGSGSDNLLTIHTNDGTERVRVDSTGTTKIVTGIVTTLTATGSAKVGSGVTLSPDGDVFTTGITTSSSVISSSVIVGGGVTISESGIEASGIGITCASINGAQIGGRRNLIINGAMMVAQRGITSTSASYHTVDRFDVNQGTVDESPTQAQADVSSGTSPYTEGFRKSLKVTNGNQSSVDATDNIIIRYKLEAQDIANSGWNYTSPSSFITLSFWIKSSVAQEFQVTLVSVDGSSYVYPTETPSLSADTWTKVTKTIPGNSNLTFNSDNGEGLRIIIVAYCGSSYSTDSATINTWNAYSSGNQFGRASTSTWYETNDATLEITGLQLEVGSQATAFEHRSFNEELTLCQRYYQKHKYGTYLAINFLGRKTGNNTVVGTMMGFPRMRAAASGTHTGAFKLYRTSDGASHSSTSVTVGQPSDYGHNTIKITAEATGFMSTGNMALAYTGSGGGTIELDAEL